MVRSQLQTSQSHYRLEVGINMPFISNTIFTDETGTTDITYTSSKYKIDKSVYTVSDKVLGIIYSALFQNYNTPIYTNNRGYFTDTHLYIFTIGDNMVQFKWTDIDLINETATSKYVPVEKTIYVYESRGSLNAFLPIIGTKSIIFIDDTHGMLYRIDLENATITKLLDVSSILSSGSTIRFSKNCDIVYLTRCSTSGTITVFKYIIESNSLTAIGTHNNTYYDYMLDVIDDKYYIGASTGSYKYWNGVDYTYYGFKITAYDLSSDTEMDYYLNKLKHYEVCNIPSMVDSYTGSKSCLKPFPLKPVWLGWSDYFKSTYTVFSAYADYTIRENNKFAISYLQAFNTNIMNNQNDLIITLTDDDEIYTQPNVGCSNVVRDKTYDKQYMIIPQFTNIDDGMSVMNIMSDFKANIVNSSNTNYGIRPDITSIHNQLLIVSLKEES